MGKYILPLKAFFVGFSLKRRHDQLQVAETIEHAINKCCEINKPLRKAFYLLIKTEITRGTDANIKNREIVKLHCEQTNNENLFNTYMTIVDATSFGYEKVDSSGIGVIDQGYYQRRIDIYQDALLSICARIDSNYLEYINDKTYPVHNHNKENTYLIHRDYNFLYNITLKEILDKHFG